MLTNARLSCGIVILIGCVVAFAVYICEGFHRESQGEDSLRLVIVVHRHGERTPTQFYKNDPYSNINKYWPQGLGQLTLKGKSQMYDVGMCLRQRYSNFIPRFSPDLVRVFSSDADRCLMSSGTLLAGMFPPAKDQVWKEEFSWQPIPIHTIPTSMDSLNGKAKCPRFDEEYSKVIKEINLNQTESLKEMYSYITSHSGTNISTINGVRKLFSTLRSEEVNGYTLPAWTQVLYNNKLREVSKLSIASNTWTVLLKRLRGGPLLKSILSNLKSKSGEDCKKKIFFYSIHDTGIVSLYRALGFEDLMLPDYGTTFIFELHQIDKKFYVKMFLMADTYSGKLEELMFPFCQGLCPLENMLEATKPVVPENWDKECQLQT